MTYQIKSRKP